MRERGGDDPRTVWLAHAPAGSAREDGTTPVPSGSHMRRRPARERRGQPPFPLARTCPCQVSAQAAADAAGRHADMEGTPPIPTQFRCTRPLGTRQTRARAWRGRPPFPLSSGMHGCRCRPPLRARRQRGPRSRRARGDSRSCRAMPGLPLRTTAPTRQAQREWVQRKLQMSSKPALKSMHPKPASEMIGEKTSGSKPGGLVWVEKAIEHGQHLCTAPG